MGGRPAVIRYDAEEGIREAIEQYAPAATAETVSAVLILSTGGP